MRGMLLGLLRKDIFFRGLLERILKDYLIWLPHTKFSPAILKRQVPSSVSASLEPVNQVFLPLVLFVSELFICLPVSSLWLVLPLCCFLSQPSLAACWAVCFLTPMTSASQIPLALPAMDTELNLPTPCWGHLAPELGRPVPAGLVDLQRPALVPRGHCLSRPVASASAECLHTRQVHCMHCEERALD